MADSDNLPMDIKAASPGCQRIPVDGKISLRELPWCGKINLRGDTNLRDGGNAQFLVAAAEALGVALPLEANTTAVGAGLLIFWLGPDEWLLHCELEHTETVLAQLRQKLARIHHAATEVTDYYSVLELKGENAAAVLARGCPLDLHHSQFGANQCAQTRFGNASILLYKPDTEPLFQLQVRWSFTEYVWDYLVSVIDSL